MLVLEDDVLEVKFKDAVVELNYPSLNDLEKIGDVKEVSGFKDFFIKLGMEEDRAEKLTINHALAIIGAFSEKKK
jgi:hypothetical protein